jgi:hypothetical protein
MNEPKTKAGKIIRKILSLFRKEAFNHANLLFQEFTDQEMTELKEAVDKEMKRRFSK